MTYDAKFIETSAGETLTLVVVLELLPVFSVAGAGATVHAGTGAIVEGGAAEIYLLYRTEA